jgi:replicative DNA helicase
LTIETENLVLTNLIYNEKYIRNVLPYIKTAYFENKNNKVLFDLIHHYFQKYNRNPTRQTLKIDLENSSNISDQQFTAISELITCLSYEVQDPQYLLDTTEEFCQHRAWALAIMEAAEIVYDKKDILRSTIPQMMLDVAAISFDTKVGHEFLSEWERRFEFYHTKENKMAFDLELMNKITHGGLPNKTLTVIMAGPYVGKSLFMNHMAASHLLDGKNVLYITMELSEESVAQRIDASLLDVPIEEIVSLDKETYQRKMERVSNKTKGRLIIKEYPAASAGAAHFRHLLNELKIKKNFIPNIIYVDYLNICLSSRIKPGTNYNMYSYIKSVCEEIRGLATEMNLPIVTATQTNRSGSASSDPELDDVSESFSIAATADFMIALVSNEEMQETKRIMVKQLKNRFGNINVHKRFLIGVDNHKFRLCDISQNGADDVSDEEEFSSPSWRTVGQSKRNFDKSKFEGVA